MPALDEQIVRKLNEQGPLVEGAIAALVCTDPRYVNAALLRLRAAKRLVLDQGVYWRTRTPADDAADPRTADAPAAPAAAPKPPSAPVSPASSAPAAAVAAKPTTPPVKPPASAPKREEPKATAVGATASRERAAPADKVKRCGRCKEPKPAAEILKYHGYCTECRRAYNREYWRRCAEGMQTKASGKSLEPAPEVAAIIQDLRDKQLPPSCSNCMFGFSREIPALTPIVGEDPGRIEWNECRRHAPTLGLPIAQFQIANRAFPVTEKIDWCGDWKAR